MQGQNPAQRPTCWGPKAYALGLIAQYCSLSLILTASDPCNEDKIIAMVTLRFVD